jgi:hypothetical protein
MIPSLCALRCLPKSLATLYHPYFGLDTKQKGKVVEDCEKSRRIYGGIVAREHSVEFRVDD